MRNTVAIIFGMIVTVLVSITVIDAGSEDVNPVAIENENLEIQLMLERMRTKNPKLSRIYSKKFLSPECPACSSGYQCCPKANKDKTYYLGCCPATVISSSVAQSSVVAERKAMSSQGGITVKCGNPAPVLLSCGIGNTQSVSSEFRVAVPKDGSSCECRSSKSASCVASCVNSGYLTELQRVKQSGTSAKCPSRKKVVACNVGNPRGSFVHYHPDKDGSACVCSPGECHATCASGVPGYEIKSLSSSGTIAVQCSKWKTVLGCGFRTGNNVSNDYLQSSFVTLDNSCECYCKQKCTCYAICGQTAK